MKELWNSYKKNRGAQIVSAVWVVVGLAFIHPAFVLLGALIAISVLLYIVANI